MQPQTRRSLHSQECKKPTPALFFCAWWPWPLTFSPKSKYISWLTMEHFCVKFGDPSYIGVRDIVLKNRQTDRQTLLKTVPLQLPSAWVMKLHGLCVCVCVCVWSSWAGEMLLYCDRWQCLLLWNNMSWCVWTVEICRRRVTLWAFIAFDLRPTVQFSTMMLLCVTLRPTKNR